MHSYGDSSFDDSLYRPRPTQYIDTAPHFEDLYKIRQATDQVINCIIALADAKDSGDTVQRATDLHGQINELKKLAEKIILQ
jgi:hypothetical protein